MPLQMFYSNLYWLVKRISFEQWLILILLIGIIFLFVRNPEAGWKKELQKEQRQLKQDVELKKKEIEKLKLQSEALNNQIEKVRDSVKVQSKATQKLRIENEKLKNRPVPDWSNNELDSIISTIVGHD